MRKTLSLAAAAAIILFAGAASAANSGCPGDYFEGQSPDILNPNLSKSLRELCYIQFGVVHSGVTATPLWSAEHLTAALVSQARSVDRDDVFHAETALPASERAELPEYRGSGYDRGHLSPAADMATVAAQNESFTLANMVPQMPALNRGPWAHLEGTTRGFATRYGEVYVVTGAVFSGAKLSKIGGRVLVPSNMYKAVYIPSTGQASAWWADNATGHVEVVSISQLNELASVDVFPSLPASVKDARVSLPVPPQLSGEKATEWTQSKSEGASKKKADTSFKMPQHSEKIIAGLAVVLIAWGYKAMKGRR